MRVRVGERARACVWVCVWMKSANTSCRRQLVWLPLRVCVWEWAIVSVCVRALLLLLPELPAIIPLVLDHTPNQAGSRRRRRQQERRVRVARYSHHKRRAQLLLALLLLLLLLLDVFPLGLLPDAVAIAVFCRHFFTVCSLGCSFVRCRLPVPASVPSRHPVPLSTIRPQAAVAAQSPMAAPSVACFSFDGLAGAKREMRDVCGARSLVRWALALPLLVLFCQKIKTHVSACGAHLHGISKVRATDRGTDGDGSDGGYPTYSPPLIRSAPHPLSVLFLCFSLFAVAGLGLRHRRSRCHNRQLWRRVDDVAHIHGVHS